MTTTKTTSYDKVLAALATNGVPYVEHDTEVEVSVGSTHGRYNGRPPIEFEAAEHGKRRTSYSNFTGQTYWVTYPGKGITVDDKIIVKFKSTGAFHSVEAAKDNSVVARGYVSVYDLQSLRMVLGWIERRNPEHQRQLKLRNLGSDLEHAKNAYATADAQYTEAVDRRSERVSQACLAVESTATILNGPQAAAVVQRLLDDGLLAVDDVVRIGYLEERRNDAANKLADIEAAIAELSS